LYISETEKKNGRFASRSHCRLYPAVRITIVMLILMAGAFSPAAAEEKSRADASAKPLTFDVHSFEVNGNTVLPEEEIKKTMKTMTGPGKTSEDVEKARMTLENLYRKHGYPTVLVNIPEQTVGKGVVRLEVVEGRIFTMQVTGNRYFTKEKIIEDLPAFAPGEILYMPRARRELNRINRNPDFKVAPVLMPGKYPGTVDIEMKVKDKFPLHASLELNNRSTHDTTDLRLNGIIHYDNLWQKEHSISFQFQTSPQDTDEVKALSGSYLLHAPWNNDHLLAVFGVWSDSDTAFGQDFQVIGKGFLMGGRYVIPLPEQKSYTHHITLGIDYKDFEESLNFAESGEEEGQDETVPITYMPLSAVYGSFLPDSMGRTDFMAGISLGFRGAVNKQQDFENKRYKSRGNYAVGELGLERTQKLPARLQAWIKLVGRVSDQPLISNEQYYAGGMASVRGYKESEMLGDDALHSMVELRSPDLIGLMGATDQVNVLPYLFYDYAALRIKDPLPSENQPDPIQGAGLGVRGSITRYIEYQADWGVALSDSDKTEAGKSRAYFKVKGSF